jgi:type VI secretion system protein ImpF
MPSAYPRDRLQPSLLDRLDDGLAPTLSRLGEARRALDSALDDAQRAALAELLKDERFEERRPGPDAMAAFAALDDADRALLDRVLELEAARRMELRRTVVLSGPELRRSVLRDLQSLLNTTAAESDPDGEGEGAFSRHPAVQASVLNYGIPALAGRIRTLDDFAELAGRIERAIERFEPRLRQVRVRPAEALAPDSAALTNPFDLVIEGELWSHPVAEHLLVRTVLDLDAGRVEIAGPERPA